MVDNIDKIIEIENKSKKGKLINSLLKKKLTYSNNILEEISKLNNFIDFSTEMGIIYSDILKFNFL